MKEFSIALRAPTPHLFVLNPATHGDVVRREPPLPEVEARAPVRQGFERGLARSAMNPSIADRTCSGMPVFHACRSDARVVSANMPRRLKGLPKIGVQLRGLGLLVAQCRGGPPHLVLERLAVAELFARSP